MEHLMRGYDEDMEERRLAPTNFTRKLELQRLVVVILLIRSTTGIMTPSSVCTRKRDEFITDGISSSRWSKQVQPRRQRTAARGGRRAATQGYHGYSVGRGVDPAGGAPGGG
ncbi:hypothetical protein F511_12448 [Dorcoceras hygrometricum]|uniref:Uncharacterized protein n=1 Tax=Dorcoceras hygrometricum TaxID=472368 RepID=A0A2Z7BYZ1_9LAMI|nr:hypothetical protein F511_12448 [Dorcoceras hygrometricum]